MALIQCPECNKDVSDKAPNCIHCGNPLNTPAPAAAYATPVPATPPKKMGIIGKIGSGILVFFIALAVIGAFSEDKTATRPIPTSSDASSNTPEFSTTSHEIEKMYAKNTVAADAKFKDKRFTITGPIAEINTDITDHAVIVLGGVENDFNRPQAELSDSDKPRAASLNKGDQISLTCTGHGDIAKTPMLKDCAIN